MIQGKKLSLTEIRRGIGGSVDPDSGEVVATETVVEQHLFMEPGGYCKHTDGVWVVQPPPRTSPVYRLASGTRTVTEHDDGTITVEGRPMPGAGKLWTLIAGNWLEVDASPKS